MTSHSSSVIPYCVAALLGYAKATGQKAAISYYVYPERMEDILAHGTKEIPIKTLVIGPTSKSDVRYGRVKVTVIGKSGKRGKTYNIRTACIHSITEGAVGQAHVFDDTQRAMCLGNPYASRSFISHI